jgi:tRNA A37 threonylcarbamoyladenosine dehydratase
MSGDRYSRQSFLGQNAEELISRCTVGVPGLGGGGSHIVQQLAHIGFKNYVIYDDDCTEESNLNRLIGAKVADARAETPKLHLAKMMIYGLQPQASVRGFACKWQDHPDPCASAISCSGAWIATKAARSWKSPAGAT